MKKSIFVIAAVMIAAIATVPVFAGRHNQNWQSRQGQMNGSPYGNGWCGSGGCGSFGGMGSNRGGMYGNNQVKVGTVSAVDVKTGIITVTDSDGKTFKVSVNPQTVIRNMTDMIARRNSMRSNPSAPGSVPVPQTFPEIITLESIKTGDWVTVNYFSTGTAVLDAAHIQVVSR